MLKKLVITNRCHHIKLKLVSISIHISYKSIKHLKQNISLHSSYSHLLIQMLICRLFFITLDPYSIMQFFSYFHLFFSLSYNSFTCLIIPGETFCLYKLYKFFSGNAPCTPTRWASAVLLDPPACVSSFSILKVGSSVLAKKGHLGPSEQACGFWRGSQVC